MAKCIKRVGIVFFAIFLTGLLALCCALSTNVIFNKNCSDYLSTNSIENSTNNARDFSDFVPDVTLGGTQAQVVQQWSTAVNQSKAKEYKVRLGHNWTAMNDEKHTFGSGEGFTQDGALFIPEGANLILDLNGFTINRNLTKETAVSGSRVFVVEGNLTIIDNKYNHEEVMYIYENCKENKNLLNANISLLSTGKIKGGAVTNEHKGGGIFVDTTGELNIYGGMICDNYALPTTGNYGGGGIYCYKGVVNMYDGIIYKNTSYFKRGGGIYVLAGTFNMYNGFVLSNSNENTWGAGVCVSGEKIGETINYGRMNITGGYFSHNYGGHGSGISSIGYSKTKISNVEISYNYAKCNSAGLLAWEGTADVTITDSKIVNNYTGGEDGNYRGGAVYCDSKITMNNVEISDNIYMIANNHIVYGGGVYFDGAADATLLNVLITRNIIKSAVNDGKHSYGGGMSISSSADVKIGGNVQIYGNTAHGISSDLRLETGQKINILDDMSNNKGKSYIGIMLAEDYGDKSFTTSYSANNSEKPNEYFFSNNDNKIATLNNNEVKFENVFDCGKYDFIYLENETRKNYKDNSYIHGVNDSELLKKANDGRVILGNISPNTSVKTFVESINFDITKICIKDTLGKEIFKNGTPIDIATYDKRFELAIGTGWYIEYMVSGKIEIIYLSVLGDVNGDGRISASDVTYIREIAFDKNLYNSLSAEKKLASMILNKGNITSSDSEIALNVMDKRLNIEVFY